MHLDRLSRGEVIDTKHQLVVKKYGNSSINETHLLSQEWSLELRTLAEPGTSRKKYLKLEHPKATFTGSDVSRRNLRGDVPPFLYQTLTPPPPQSPLGKSRPIAYYSMRYRP